MLVETPRTHLELLAIHHAKPLRDYHLSNQDHLGPWEPTRAKNYHSEDAWMERIRSSLLEYDEGQSLRMVAHAKENNEIVGLCNFTNITRGPFQACYLGYSISAAFGNQGLMTEIVDHAVDYVFSELDLHRVMANYMPENERSARVLEKLGFEKEGYAKSYLKIAGSWRDHVLTAKINPHLSAHRRLTT